MPLNVVFQARLNMFIVYVMFGLVGVTKKMYKFVKFVSNAIKWVSRAFDEAVGMSRWSRILREGRRTFLMFKINYRFTYNTLSSDVLDGEGCHIWFMSWLIFMLDISITYFYHCNNINIEQNK